MGCALLDLGVYRRGVSLWGSGMVVVGCGAVVFDMVGLVDF